MTSHCRACLQDTVSETGYHPRCLKQLFGSARLPTIDIELAKLHTVGLAMVGHTSLSGIQKKISVNLSADRATLQMSMEGNRYILKPQANTFPALPENEHVTTRLAELVGIDTAPNGLVLLKDGSAAFLVARFDRTPDRHKLRMEDFCQLAELSPKQKYEGSAELCMRLLRKYAAEPVVEILKLYRLFVFGWWTGNGDLHLKNLALLAGPDGRQRLSPAYDLVCTRLVIEDDQLAIPICGRKDRLSRANWLQFAEYCALPKRAAERVLTAHIDAIDAAQALVARSFLPQEMKDAYRTLLEARTSTLK